jgi:pimeloyl-ACP methyl ester carboxylesterase
MDRRTGWTEGTVTVAGRSVFYRRAGRTTAGATEAVPIVHVHGFGISGSYLMPTARVLASRGDNVVPDLPGYGRSEGREQVLDIPGLADALLSVLDALDLRRVVLVGNSMGCPVSLEVAHAAPERVHRLVLVSPAGGVHNQPLPRALTQLAVDGVRESPRMARVAVPDYLHFGPLNALRLFRQLTRFPSLERLLHTPVPSLAVLGSKDPLMPPPHRVQEVGRLAPRHVTVVLIEGAAHAINFSHPGELAHVIDAWLDGREIVDDPSQPGRARVVDVRSPG